ncbi:MAG: peptidyl-prolyl cis-trans isomerase [Tannerella sp.]|nr:peptidyl-prolyl cis-trans isomerase [Tannerella sp.]
MRTIVFFLAVCLLHACRRPPETVGSDVVVKVNGQTLTRSEVEYFIPNGTPHADSLLIAEHYVTKWVKDQLTYEAAKRNIGNGDADINRLVEEYRRSLLTHRYQENLIRTRLASEIPEEEKQVFYRENPKKFILSGDVIRGLFLMAPVDAPGLEDIRKKYRRSELDVVEEIEKFSIQNAVMYEYFYDRWVDFDKMLSKIPVSVPNTSQYLKTKQFIEVSDSLYCYLLNISEYVLSGNVAPYEYAVPQIRELVINKKKIEFLKNTEDELYRDAVRKGQVVFYANQEPDAK